MQARFLRKELFGCYSIKVHSFMSSGIILVIVLNINEKLASTAFLK